jgi:uncharacterized protein YqfA (UPF0365 family)
MARSKKLATLDELLKQTDTKADFNIVEDLKSLERLYGVIKSRDYRKKLQALVAKYEKAELTEVRNALLSKCRQGDTQAIRLYADYFKPAENTAEDDGLAEALTKASKEVFADD